MAIHIQGFNRKTAAPASLALWAILTGCGGGGGSAGGPPATATPAPTATPMQVYEPLSVGDSWSYDCHNTGNPNEPHYTIRNSITGTTTVGNAAVFEFAMQIPSSPSQITTVTELLANDAHGNTTIYGYLINGAVQAITPAIIVSATPVVNSYYNYTGIDGATVTRQFVGIEPSNKTGLGVFTVAPYFESGGTHNYGYASGVGIVEEDHGPNFLYDCLVQSATVH